MKREHINAFIEKHWRELSDQEIAVKCAITTNAVRHRFRSLGLKRDTPPRPSKKQFEDLQREAERLRMVAKTTEALRGTVNTHTISAAQKVGGETTVIALASDWHVEEQVLKEQVNDKNEYTLQLAKKRADHFFRTLLRLVEIERQNTRVETLVLALLGDFITGNIHEDAVRLLEENEALRYAQELIVSGIQYLLDNSDLKIICVCHSGNHARITKKQRIATEYQHSQEWLMYKLGIEPHFKSEKRIKFIIPTGYHSYLQIYDKRVRFHHGHQIRYGGGVGGITIPINKAVNEWNKIDRVDLDCLGHFHQALDGGNFIVNGSLIGFSPYAISIKASPEEPQQMFVGIHSKLGLYLTRRIKCNV